MDLTNLFTALTCWAQIARCKLGRWQYLYENKRDRFPRPSHRGYVGERDGSDLATMKAQHFTGLRLEDVRPLLERPEMTDEEMVVIWAIV